MRKRLLLKPILAFVDIAILVGTFQLAYWLRFQASFLPERPVPSFELYFRFSFLVALIGFGMLHSSGLYRLRHLSFHIEDFFSILRAVTFTALIIMATNFILRGYIAGGGYRNLLAADYPHCVVDESDVTDALASGCRTDTQAIAPSGPRTEKRNHRWHGRGGTGVLSSGEGRGGL